MSFLYNYFNFKYGKIRVFDFFTGKTERNFRAKNTVRIAQSDRERDTKFLRKTEERYGTVLWMNSESFANVSKSVSRSWTLHFP